MSWGERSCKKYGSCTIATYDECNVNCAAYESNGMEPDSKFNPQSQGVYSSKTGNSNFFGQSKRKRAARKAKKEAGK